MLNYFSHGHHRQNVFGQSQAGSSDATEHTLVKEQFWRTQFGNCVYEWKNL